MIWVSDEDEDNFIETGLCPRRGADIRFSRRRDGTTIYSCPKCGWSEAVPPMPKF